MKGLIEKCATRLDLKKVAASSDEIANELSNLKKDLDEIREGKETEQLKDMIEEIKMKMKSQDNRSQALQKNFRLLD